MKKARTSRFAGTGKELILGIVEEPDNKARYKEQASKEKGLLKGRVFKGKDKAA